MTADMFTTFITMLCMYIMSCMRFLGCEVAQVWEQVDNV